MFLNIPTVLVPPFVFLGLAVALWTWKCCMMVLFQNKIIYMPGLPPNARRETIAYYEDQCGGIKWREERIRSGDGTRISLCLASVHSGREDSRQSSRIYILYFQGHLPFLSQEVYISSFSTGNTSSLPPRLPFISPVLRMLRDRPLETSCYVQYMMVCCSYRGYWTSKGRPSEKGIALDAAAALEWIKADHERQNGSKNQPAQVTIWGQSIGAGVATNLAAQQDQLSAGLLLKVLILETPFLSVRAMLETLYPQKWLPYRHLWPFLWNHLDSWKALGVLGEKAKSTGARAPSVLILEAGRDELVPSSQGDTLESRCLDVGLAVRRKVVDSALHNEVLVRQGGRAAVVEAVRNAASDTCPR
jgi:fermentation-respiration switch protein FrsA (DUF1100 family)